MPRPHYPYSPSRKSRGSAYRVNGVSDRYWWDDPPKTNTRLRLKRLTDADVDEALEDRDRDTEGEDV